MLRYRMNNLIRMMENDDRDALNNALKSDIYQKAMKALEDEGCVETLRDWSGTIHKAFLRDHYVTYQLSRQDVWINRFWGFLAGIATSVIVAFITGILHI